MKLPNWFKVIWWVILTGSAGWLFYSRMTAISAGRTAPVDIFIFLVLVALLLVPIFQEVSFLGLKFKQVMDDLKQNIATQLMVFKADIQTTMNNTSNVNVLLPQSAPPDDQLPGIEQRIRAAVSEALQQEGFSLTRRASPEGFHVDNRTDFLFRARHTIETKLRRIASAYADLPHRRAVPVQQLSAVLVKQQLLHPSIANAIREIYSVCSPAIHGEPVTDAQLSFVREVAPEVVDALDEIERRTGGLSSSDIPPTPGIENK
jgi:hypothetical protein